MQRVPHGLQIVVAKTFSFLLSAHDFAKKTEQLKVDNANYWHPFPWGCLSSQSRDLTRAQRCLNAHWYWKLIPSALTRGSRGKDRQTLREAPKTGCHNYGS